MNRTDDSKTAAVIIGGRERMAEKLRTAQAVVKVFGDESQGQDELKAAQPD